MMTPTLQERQAYERVKRHVKHTRAELCKDGAYVSTTLESVYRALVSERASVQKAGPFATVLYAEYLKIAVDCSRCGGSAKLMVEIYETAFQDMVALRWYRTQNQSIRFSPYEKNLIDGAVADCYACLTVLKQCLGAT